jgi:hypothetical protein
MLRFLRYFAEKVGGKGWRKKLAEKVGGKSWRKKLAEKVGGKSWRKKLACLTTNTANIAE